MDRSLMNYFKQIYSTLKTKLKFYFVKLKYFFIAKARDISKSCTLFAQKYTFFLISSLAIYLTLYFDFPIKDYDFSNILLSLLSIIGTILALVFTLSLIPIQNAASMWSFSILRIYKKDRVSYIVFSIFGLLILTFILFTLFEIYIDETIIFLSLVLFVGVMLDSLRYYYTHIVSLMDPQSILEKIKIQSFKTIDDIDARAKTVAKNHHFLQEEKENIKKLEADVYKKILDYPQSIIYWFNDLAEIYQKSIARNDLIVAKSTLDTMQKILEYFVEKRKENISYHLVPTGLLPAKEADITQDIITPLCEVLKDLFDISCKSSTENMALEVITAYKNMAIYLSKIDIQLIQSPIHYAKECIKNAQLKESIEIPYQSVQIIYEIHRNIESENAFLILDESIIELFEDVAKYLYTKNRSEAAENVLRNLMQLNYFDRNFKRRFERVLQSIERLIPFGLIIELSGTRAFYNPLGEVYSLTSASSIGNLFNYISQENNARLTRKTLEIIYRHFRNIAEKYDIQNSFMIHEINSTIEYISGINLYLLKEDTEDAQKLKEKFKWLLSFYWVEYDNKQVFNENYLRKCMQTLKKIGMDYLACGFDDVYAKVLGHMESIIKIISNISTDEFLIQNLQDEYNELENRFKEES